MGRRRPVSSRSSSGSTSQIRRAAARSGTISANGRSSRCFLARSAVTASCRSARTARWYPPIPLTARSLPCLSRPAAAATGSPGISRSEPSTSRRRGPHLAQHSGWAWNRLLAGSWYSAEHSSHIANAAIVVPARSYGEARTIVKRGPQAVQLMNG